MADIESNVVDNSNIQEIGNDAEKQLKTNSYTLNAIKRYRAKNADKVKEYNKIYHLKKKDELKKINPYLDYTKQQLFDKIFALEAEIKELKT
jgi:hypothetical protein